MIPVIIELSVLLSKTPKQVTLVTKDEGVLSMLEEQGSLIAKHTGITHLRAQAFDPEGVRRGLRVDYEKVEEQYGKDTPIIIGKIATLSAESVKKNTKEGIIMLTLNGKEYALESSWIEERVEAPEGFTKIQFSKGYILFKEE
ncbi:hypothetical protein COT72_02650 [archaeon CG10_big_fil_rev_8_21_14_0_10_43_11]|nr:MAG: hypothetical protein COT72_02650 [archaeon CG10_big_fil_rev_8_21_14_0_10_43_11]